MPRLQSNQLMASQAAPETPAVSHYHYNGDIIWSIFFPLWKLMKTSGRQKCSSLNPLRSQELGIVSMRLILDYLTYVHVTVLTSLCFCFLISPVEAARRAGLAHQAEFEPPLCTYI